MTAGADDDKKPSQATRLIQLADGLVEVVAGEDGRAYAVNRSGPGAHIAFPLKGQRGLRTRLAKAFTDAYGAVPSQSALTDVTAVLEGRAMDLDPRPVALRLASHEGQVVLDLGGADGRCVIAGPEGWQLSDTSPVLFRRTALTTPLATPTEPGRTENGIAVLRSLVNTSEPTFRMLVGWLVSALMPSMPHPILAARGEQGTGKSTTTAELLQIIDRSPAPLRSLPKDAKTWAITASASWSVCLDNVSTIQPWLSDTLCKAVTGDGFLDRALYSDDDVSVVSFRRLLAMTSIDTGALASDLTERLLPIEFLPIKRDQRRGDAEVRRTFADNAPAILAALLDLLAGVLAELPTVQLAEMPRMADFARVLAAVDRITGWQTLDTYLAATEVTTSDLLDAKPFASAVADFLTEGGTGAWTGTIGQLLELVEVPEPRPKSWPVDPTRAAGQLKRDAPVLRSVGISVEEAGRSRDRNRSKLYRLCAQSPLAKDFSDQHGQAEEPGDSAGGALAADSAASAPEPACFTANPQATAAGGSWGAAEPDADQLSTDGHPVPLARGTCRACQRPFRRYSDGYGDTTLCASCALGGGPPLT